MTFIRGELKHFVTLVFLYIFISVFHSSSADSMCEELPVINNGQIILEGHRPPFNVNEFVHYRCNEDFRSDQVNPKVVCILVNDVANWTDTENACKPIVRSCHDPGYIENADRIGNVFTFPHNITYVCNAGFKMKGRAVKFCSKTGVWQPPHMPYCEAILCPDLADPPNGKVLFSTRNPNSVARYKCERKYNLTGSSVLICQSDGTWNDSIPICKEITCANPGKFLNGRIIGNKTVYLASDIVIFQCDDGTHITAKCLENGEWSERPPVCSEINIEVSVTSTSTDDSTPKSETKVSTCEDPGEIKNGDRRFVGLHINSTVTYICDEGYQLKGKATLLCLENGKWDLDKLPICVMPLSVPAIIGILIGVIIFVCIGVGGYFLYKYRMRSIRGYGEKSKALTADATDLEEITGLDRDKKPIPVTVL